MSTGASKEKAARFISAEFHAAGYVSKGKMWASYTDESGARRVQAFA